MTFLHYKKNNKAVEGIGQFSLLHYQFSSYFCCSEALTCPVQSGHLELACLWSNVSLTEARV